MNTKDKLNKISGIISLSLFTVIVLGYVLGNELLFGFPNAMLLYALMPFSTNLVWY